MSSIPSVYEGAFTTNWAINLNVPIIQNRVDVFQQMLEDDPDGFAEFLDGLEVEREIFMPKSYAISEITRPIGLHRIYKTVNSEINSTSMKLKEVGVSLEYFPRELKYKFGQWYEGGEPVHRPDLVESGKEGAKTIVLDFIATQNIIPAMVDDTKVQKWFSKPTSHKNFLKGYRGYWQSYFEADPTLSRRITNVLDENPLSLSAVQIRSIFREMIDKQTDEMKAIDSDQKMFIVDEGYYTAAMRSINDIANTQAGAIYWDVNDNGRKVLKFEEIVLHKKTMRSRVIAQDPAGAGKGKYERRIILTTKNNFKIGTNRTAKSAMNLIMRYDEDRESNKFKTSVFFDTVLGWTEYVVVALSARNTPFILPKAALTDAEKEESPYYSIDGKTFYGGINNSTSDAVTAAVGATITIRGNNFLGATLVQVGAVTQTVFTVVDDNTITFVGQAAAANTVRITTPGGLTASAQTLAIA